MFVIMKKAYGRRYTEAVVKSFIFLFFVLASVRPAYAVKAQVLSSKRECANCHISWMDDFKIEGIKIFVDRSARGVVLIQGRQGVVSSEEICYTCHDGGVMDSRALPWTEGGHPVYVKPSKDVTIPKSFPLDKYGRIYCGTCHSAHGVDWGKSRQEKKLKRTVFLRFENPNSFLCMQCHKNKVRGGRGEKGHNHPVNVTSIKLPDEIKKLGGKVGFRKDQVICESCHKVHGAKGGYKLLIKSVKNAELCGVCHYDRFTHSMKEASVKRTHPVNVKPITANISRNIKKLGAKVGTKGEVTCLSCHKPHNNPNEHLLVKTNKGNAICFECHPAQANAIVNTKHDLTIKAPKSKNALKQTPAQSGVCGVCHLPHKGFGAKMWSRKPSKDKDPIVQLCNSCHQKGAVGSTKLVGKISHPVGISMEGADGESKLPLYDGKTGARTFNSKKGMVVCASCHNPHQWDPEVAKNTRNVTEIEGNHANSFLRQRNDIGTPICYECHIDKSLIEGTDHDMMMMAVKHPRSHCVQMLGMSGKQEQIQLPSEEVHKLLGKEQGTSTGICGTCHTPHNAVTYPIWSRELGPGANAGDKLCFTCHAKDRVAEVKQLGRYTHPTGVDINRLGIKPITKLPLYDKNLKKISGEEGGEVHCFSCHDLHQWDPRVNKKGPGVKIEGDTGNSFTRISAQDDKFALCYDCHYDKALIVDTKHDLNLNFPNDKNYRGQNVAESGVCFVCHNVHNAVAPWRLWNRSLGPGKDAMSKLCNSCHQEGAVGQKYTVGKHSHPLGVSILKAKPDGDIPFLTYREDLYKIKKGLIMCGSCHNPHIWNPNKWEKGDGKLKEGDFSNSFLNASNDNGYGLCIICHYNKDTIVDTKHDLSVSAPDATNAFGETVAQKGPCWQCHRVHNTLQDSRLWARPLGPGDDGISQFCQACHSDGRCGYKKQVGENSHLVMADMRMADGYTSWPLFNEKGQREPTPKGLVTCGSCHNPHRWDPSVLKRGPGVNTEGDTNNSFLRARNVPAPDFCGECHVKKALVYKTDHDMAVTAPDAKNLLGQTVFEGGTCSACHVPHNAAYKPRIFAREPGPPFIGNFNTELGEEVDWAVQFCTTCHSSGAPGEAKEPPVGLHPYGFHVSSSSTVFSEATLQFEPLKYLYKTITRTMTVRDFREGIGRPQFSPYDNYGYISSAGDLTCPTCHNLHVWEADKFETGPGINTEGKVNDSFLRPKLLYNFCIDCHSYDALYRMKYFHHPRSREKLDPNTIFEELRKRKFIKDFQSGKTSQPETKR